LYCRECSAEEYYFALRCSIGSVQLKNVTLPYIEVLEVFIFSGAKLWSQK